MAQRGTERPSVRPDCAALFAVAAEAGVPGARSTALFGSTSEGLRASGTPWKGGHMEERELYDAVGRVAVESAAMEAEVALNVEVLLDSECGEVIASGQSFSQLRQMATELIRYGWPILPEDLRTEYLALLAEASELQERRNAVVHGRWSAGGPDAPGQVMRPRRWARREAGTNYSRDDLLQLAQALQDMTIKFRLVGPRLAAERHPERQPFGEDEWRILRSVWRGRHYGDVGTSV